MSVFTSPPLAEREPAASPVGSPAPRPRRRRRRVRSLLALVLVLALGGAGAWWWWAPSEVEVVVDGDRVAWRTRAQTVAGALEDRGITLAAHDRVEPPLESGVNDGTTIRVARARPVTLEVNGVTRTVWTTGVRVEDLLVELGIEPRSVEPAPAEPLAAADRIVVRTASEVVVTVDGAERRFLSAAPTVRELLEDAGVVLDGDDEVTPGADAPIAEGLTVDVTRVETDVSVEERSIPFETVRREDGSLSRGTVKTVQDGRSGLERIEYRVTVKDGEETDREVVSRSVVREPQSRILVVGTKVSNATSGKASWYSGPAGTCAHRTLAFGTQLSVTNVANGKSVVCRVADRGPFVEGRVVDLSHDSFSQLASPSTGIINVRISW